MGGHDQSRHRGPFAGDFGGLSAFGQRPSASSWGTASCHKHASSPIGRARGRRVWTAGVIGHDLRLGEQPAALCPVCTVLLRRLLPQAGILATAQASSKGAGARRGREQGSSTASAVADGRSAPVRPGRRSDTTPPSRILRAFPWDCGIGQFLRRLRARVALTISMSEIMAELNSCRGSMEEGSR